MLRQPAIHRVVIAQKSFVQGLFWTIGTVTFATAFRWIIDQGAAGAPFVTYFPAVALVSLFCGWRWGALAAVLSAVIGNRVYRPDLPFWNFSSYDLIMTALFAFSCAILIYMGNLVRIVLGRLEEVHSRDLVINSELQHRIGNLLAIVSAIAFATRRNARPEDFYETFSQRLQALTVANRLQVELGAAVDLRRLVEAAIAPFADTGQFEVDGPDVLISEATRLALSLAIHELCTNAVKYGALSTGSGKVSLTWKGCGDMLEIAWRERGGPRVGECHRTGMGTALLKSQRGLNVDIRFEPDGVACDLVLPRFIAEAPSDF
jgi:two-component sensor histidine kinase